MTTTLNDFFRQGLLGKMIPSFNYPVRWCPYCEHELTVIDAIHITEDPLHYKTLYICKNNDCQAYDEAARSAYARVYYSSEEAYAILETQRIYYANEKKL